MAATLLSGAVTCFAALFLGQASLRLAGAREWSWLAPAVGLSVAMLVAAPASDVPGRGITMAVLLGALTAAAAVWCLQSPPHRPPLPGLLAAAPVALLVLVPFLAAGRTGILGVGVDNDMASHLFFAEHIVSSAVTPTPPLPSEYPLGPHDLAALLGQGLGVHLDTAFTGWTMAIPVLNAWVAQAVVRRASWFGRGVLATVAGMPFLVAAYYGEGSFKELVLAGLVLAIVLSLSGCGPRLANGRWVPVALLTGGIISVYSLAGLPWPLVMVGLWLLGGLAIRTRRGRVREIPRELRDELPAVGIAAGILTIALLPQAHRLWEFAVVRHGSGISSTELGNLIGFLSGWEALGVWSSADFRQPVASAFTVGFWTVFVLALVLLGAYWAVRRGRWMLPLAAGGAMAIWRVAQHSQSPYVTAKALVIASPLLLLVAVLPLVDRESGRRPSWPWLLVPLLGGVLFLRVGSDDLRALRWSPVGPTDHARQLESFRPLLGGRPTLFLGNDEFVLWELANARLASAVIAAVPQIPLRARKEWEYGQALDFDSVRAATLNEYEWIVTTRDAASSAAPPQLRLVGSTDDFLLWKRTGPIPEHSILREGEWPGAILRCHTREGRALLAMGGVAAVRRPPMAVPVAPPEPADTASARLRLPVGVWQLEAPYTSPYPLEVEADGLRTTLPANLERPGPRLPLGRVTVRRPLRLSISFRLQTTFLAPPSATASINRVVATRVGEPDRVVSLARACGKYVDWYRPARQAPSGTAAG